MSARVMNAPRASALERTICATAGIAGTVRAHGLSPEVDPEEWPRARYVLVWGWNPLSTGPHLWRKLLDARKAGARLVVVDPSAAAPRAWRTSTAAPAGRDAALGVGMMRAIDRRSCTTTPGPRARAEGYDELLAALGGTRSGATSGSRHRRGGDRARRREFAPTRPALLRLGVEDQRHLGAPVACSTLSSLPRSPRRLGVTAAVAARNSRRPRRRR